MELGQRVGGGGEASSGAVTGIAGVRRWREDRGEAQKFCIAGEYLAADALYSWLQKGKGLGDMKKVAEFLV